MIKKIGISREDKPFELRTPIVPIDVKALINELKLEIVVEPSEQRAFSEKIYQGRGTP